MKAISCSKTVTQPTWHGETGEYYFIHAFLTENGAIILSADDFDFEIPADMVQDYDLTLSGIERRIDADIDEAANHLIACATAEEAARFLCHGPKRLTRADTEAYMKRFEPGGDYYNGKD